MKEITRQQIEDAILSVSKDNFHGNLMKDFYNNIEDFEKITKDANINITKDQAAIFSAYITATQRCILIMGDVLCKLLCDEEKEN